MQASILNDGIVNRVRQDNCFDFLRYFFAISLILAHFCTATNSPQFWFITGSMRVKAFFTITGFLVTYSFLRRDMNIRSYAIKRFVRIIPAYVVCVLFCFAVGLSISTLSSSEFLASHQTWHYFFANLFMLNWLEPELPQTFQSNPLPQMNASLWSMKQEVVFYVLVPILVHLMKTKRMRNYVCSAIVVICVISYNFVNHQTEYFMYFLFGMILLLYFDIFCKYRTYLSITALLVLIPVYAYHIPYVSAVCNALEPLCFPMVLLYVAYNAKHLNFFRKFDNITYGLYLYHFPVAQVLILYGWAEHNITLCFVGTFIITIFLAYCSFKLIEEPLMNRYR